MSPIPSPTFTSRCAVDSNVRPFIGLWYALQCDSINIAGKSIWKPSDSPQPTHTFSNLNVFHSTPKKIPRHKTANKISGKHGESLRLFSDSLVTAAWNLTCMPSQPLGLREFITIACWMFKSSLYFWTTIFLLLNQESIWVCMIEIWFFSLECGLGECNGQPV